MNHTVGNWVKSLIIVNSAKNHADIPSFDSSTDITMVIFVKTRF